jgi:hypothetical protein
VPVRPNKKVGFSRRGGRLHQQFERWSNLSRSSKNKIPALSLQKPERQGQGPIVSKIRKKGWAPLPSRTLYLVICHTVPQSGVPPRKAVL